MLQSNNDVAANKKSMIIITNWIKYSIRIIICFSREFFVSVLFSVLLAFKFNYLKMNDIFLTCNTNDSCSACLYHIYIWCIHIYGCEIFRDSYEMNTIQNAKINLLDRHFCFRFIIRSKFPCLNFWILLFSTILIFFLVFSLFFPEIPAVLFEYILK